MGQIVGSAVRGAESIGESKVRAAVALLCAVALVCAAGVDLAKADLVVSNPQSTGFESPWLFSEIGDETISDVAFSGSKGVAAATALSGGVLRLAVSYTTDGGKNWNYPTSVPVGANSPYLNQPGTPAGSASAYSVGIDGDNAIVMWGTDDPNKRVQVAYSSDGGKNWSYPDSVPVGAGPNPTISPSTENVEVPNISMDGNRAIVVWSNRGLPSGGVAQAAITSNGGRDWSSPTSTPFGTPAVSDPALNVNAASVSLSGSTATVANNEIGSPNGSVRLLRTTTGGDTWSEPITPTGQPGVISGTSGAGRADEEGLFSNVTVKGDRGLVSWTGRTTSGSLAAVAAHTSDGGATWSWSHGPSGALEISPPGGTLGFEASGAVPASVSLNGNQAVMGWSRTVGSSARPEAAFSTDYGATWQYPGTVPAGTESPGLAPFGAGGLVRTALNNQIAVINGYRLGQQTALFASPDGGQSWQTTAQAPAGGTAASLFGSSSAGVSIGNVALQGYGGSLVAGGGSPLRTGALNFKLAPTCGSTSVVAAPGQVLSIAPTISDTAGETPQVTFSSTGVASATLNDGKFQVVAGQSGVGTINYTATNSVGTCANAGQIKVTVDETCTKLSTASASASVSRAVRFERGSFRLYGPSYGYTVQSSNKAPTSVKFSKAKAKTVTLSIDGKLVSTSRSKQPKFNVNPQQLTPGVHSLTATAKPKSGKSKKAIVRFRVLSCVPATVAATAKARGHKGTLTFTSNSGGQPLKVVDTKLGKGIALEIGKKQLGKKLGTVSLTNSRSARTVLPLTVPKKLSSAQRKRGPIVLYDKSGLKIAMTPGRNLRLLATGLTGSPVSVQFKLGYRKPTGVPKRCASLKLNSTMQAANNSVATAKNTLRACS